MAIEESSSANTANGADADQLSSRGGEPDIVERYFIQQLNPVTHQVLKVEEVDQTTGERKELGLFDLPNMHRVMVRDHVRTDSFRRALFAAVKEGDVVLDIGTGSGILSLFAAQAGASKVYAVDPSPVVGLAQELIALNNVQRTVEVVQERIEDVQLPVKVDVIVSEWLGVYGVDENMLGSVLLARDRWLKPGGRLIPGRVTAWLAPVLSGVRIDTEFFHSNPYGLDLALLSESSVHELMIFRTVFSGNDVQAEPQAMWTTDPYRFPVEEAALPFEASLTFTFERQARVNALVAWFSAELGNGLVLSNAPGQAPTSWGQFPFPLERTVELEPGAEMAVQFTSLPAGPGYCHQAWSARVGHGPWEHHGTNQPTGSLAG